MTKLATRNDVSRMNGRRQRGVLERFQRCWSGCRGHVALDVATFHRGLHGRADHGTRYAISGYWFSFTVAQASGLCEFNAQAGVAAATATNSQTEPRPSSERARRHGRPVARRGNALVLAAGILALLVIIATAYISRTQVDRVMGAAQQRAEVRDAAAQDAARLVAGLIGESLFVRPVNDAPAPFGDLAVLSAVGRPATSNWPRLPIAADAVPFGFDDLYPYNHAPYAVAPYTNWPDASTLQFIYPGSPGPYDDYVPPHGDRVGNPGFGDTRWLRDSEPMRMAVDDPTPWLPNGGGPGGLADELSVYVQWLHMSNIATAENGIRIVSDIADVHDLALADGTPGQDGIGLPVTELMFPVEQRLPAMWNQNLTPPAFDYLPAYTDITSPGAITDFRNGGNPSIITDFDLPNDANEFLERWARWLLSDTVAAGYGYPNQFRGLGPLGIPANYLKLGDLDGDGTMHNSPLGDRPEDEFKFGTARHTVSRVLCDSDGDGFTDSFWFLLPTNSVAGTSTIVGVSIVDNAGKLNLNAASKFEFANQNLEDLNQAFNPFSTIIEPTDPFRGRTATIGHTPADLALVSELFDPYVIPLGDPPTLLDLTLPANKNWNVGFADNPLHQEAYWRISLDPGFDPYGDTHQAYDWEMWRDYTTGSGPTFRPLNFLAEVGVLDNSFFETDHELRTQVDRLRYFRGGAARGASPRDDVTPFTLADEIELRLFAGQNQPWTASRLERSMQSNVMLENSRLLLRGTREREETSEFLDQLTNVEMVRDLRDKVTLFSSTRNDRLPPWLWWAPLDPFDLSTTIPSPLMAPSRIQTLVASQPTPQDAQRVRDAFFAQSRRKVDLRDGLSTAVDPSYYEVFGSPHEGELSFRERLPYALRLALIDYNGGGTYGSTQAETEKTVAGLAANLEAYRSRGDALQYPAVDDTQFLSPLPPTVTPADLANRAVLIDPDAPTTSDRMLGLEEQPFILEAFIAHVYPASVLDSGFDGWYFAQDATPGLPFDSPLPPPGGSFSPHSVPCDPNPLDSVPTLNPAWTDASDCAEFRRWVDDSSEPTTVVVVQIANPFTESDETGVDFDQQGIDLNEYAIRVFGRTLRIDEMQLTFDKRFLKPATEEKPRSAIFYLIPDSLDMPAGAPSAESAYFLPETDGVGGVINTSFKGQWKNFLDIVPAFDLTITDPLASDLFVDPAATADRTIVIDVLHPDGTMATPTYSEVWSSDRTTYDNYAAGGANERAIEILRKVTYPDGRIEWVVVDRTGSVDASGASSTANDEFTRRVGELPRPPAASGPADWANGQFNGIRLYTSTETPPEVCDRWVPWVRMTRAWGYDFDFDSSAPDDDGDAISSEPEDSNNISERLGIQANERAPRFVFGREFVSKADNQPDHVGEPASAPNVTWHSDMYRSNSAPDPTAPYSATDPDRPWFKKRHVTYGDITLPTLELRRKPFFFTMNPVYVDDDLGALIADLDAFPDDVYLPFNGGTTPAGTAVSGYGFYFWYVDLANPSLPLLAWQSPAVAPGAGIPSKGLLEPEAGAVLSQGAEPSDSTALAFRNYFPHSLQMNQKDGDFEQVGELFNLWERGHELPQAASGGTVNPSTDLSLGEPPGAQNIWPTKVTFTERMGQLVGTGPGVPNNPGPRVNRLSFGPVIGDADAGDLADLNHAVPALPAGLRVLDAFVCDGPGRDAYILDIDDDDTDGILDELSPTPAINLAGVMIDPDHFALAEARSFRNAQAFSGAGTPGLLNLNTATVEALRSLPQGAAIVNELFRLRNQPPGEEVNKPSEFVRSDNYLPDALISYRDCLAAMQPGATPTEQWEPTYAALISSLGPPPGLMEPMRSGYPPSGVGDPVIPTGIRDEFDPASAGAGGIANLAALRGERGFASIGEIALAANQPNAPVGSYLAQAPPLPVGEVLYPYRWRMDMLGQADVDLVDPFSGASPWTQTPLNQPVSASLSVDTTKVFDSSVTQFSGSSPSGTAPQGQMIPDRTAKDNEELNMLMAGMSNLVSTRSDMFTVYLKVRTFRQDPATGRWDATKKENILDDSRYVMLVDRSNVNTPGDQPRILYFEKVAK